MRTRIKICGITRHEDAQAAVAAGADALGFVFYSHSPRNVSVAVAKSIVATLPPFVTSIGLFVNAAPSEVKNVLDHVALDCLQFQGEETPAYCQQFNRPYLKALRIKPDSDVQAMVNQYVGARGVLLDSFDSRQHGGTGQTFDWTLVPNGLSLPVILAGGLNPSNVAQAIRTVRPYAVDISSGVEASKGIKDHAKIRAFIDEVHRVDRG